MALSQRQMRIVGALLAIVLLGGAVGIVFYQMQKPGKVLVVDTGLTAPANPTGAAQAARGKPVSGVIVNGDGKPVAGVEVVLVPEGYGFDLNGPRSQSFPIARSDKDGKFDFPQPSAWSDLAVIGDTGFAQVGRTEMPTDGKIIVRPWGRVEGTFLVGKMPQPNQQLSLYPLNMGRALATTNPSSPYRLINSGGRVRISQRATTDAQGHFVFERVGPGSMMISRIVITGRMARSSNLANVDVRAGETASVEIGGKGRPVIGRVVADRNEEALPPISGSIDLMAPAATAGRRAFAPGPDWPKLSEQERQRLVDEWLPTIRHLQLQAAIAVAADGTFRADDIPAGQHSIRMYSQSVEPGSASIEMAADVTVPLEIPPMPDGRSDEPFDAGTITLKVRPRVKVGSPAPAVEAAKADGSVIKLSDYRGKYVLLSMVYDYGTMRQPDVPELQRMGGVLTDRFEDNGIVRLAVMLPQRQMGTQHTTLEIPGWTTAAIANWEQKLDPAYVNSRGSYLIDPQGVVLAKLGPYGNMAYGSIDKMLGVMKRRGPGVVVSVEKLTGPAATKVFAFQTIPTISKDDAGQAATFSIVDGRKAGFGAELQILNDGLGPRHDRDERLMLTFDPGTVEGRISADLGKAIDVEAINTYAW